MKRILPLALLLLGSLICSHSLAAEAPPAVSQGAAPSLAQPPASPLYELASFAITAAAGVMQSPLYTADVLAGDLGSGGASSPQYRSGSGFLGSVLDSAFTVSVPSPPKGPAEFPGIRVLRQASRIGVSFVLPNSGRCKLVVHDVTGRVIRSDDGEFPTGIATLWWDGRDTSGRLMANGIYFLRVGWNGRTDSARALWLH